MNYDEAQIRARIEQDFAEYETSPEFLELKRGYKEWLAQHALAQVAQVDDIPDELDRSGEMCEHMAKLFARKVQELEVSVHDTGVSAFWAFGYAAQDGHHGFKTALAHFRMAFTAMPRARDLNKDFDGIVSYELPKLLYKMVVWPDCACDIADYSIAFVHEGKEVVRKPASPGDWWLKRLPKTAEQCRNPAPFHARSRDNRIISYLKNCDIWRCDYCRVRKLKRHIEIVPTDVQMYAMFVSGKQKSTVDQAIRSYRKRLGQEVNRMVVSLKSKGQLILSDAEISGRRWGFRSISTKAAIRLLLLCYNQIYGIGLHGWELKARADLACVYGVESMDTFSETLSKATVATESRLSGRDFLYMKDGHEPESAFIKRFDDVVLCGGVATISFVRPEVESAILAPMLNDLH